MLFHRSLGRKIPHGARARATFAPEGAFPRGSPRGRAEKLIFVRRTLSPGESSGSGGPRGPARRRKTARDTETTLLARFPARRSRSAISGVSRMGALAPALRLGVSRGLPLLPRARFFFRRGMNPMRSAGFPGSPRRRSSSRVFFFYRRAQKISVQLRSGSDLIQ